LVDKVSLEFEQNLIPIVIPPPRQLSYLVFAGVASLLFARQLGLPRAISFTIGGLLVLAFTVLVIQQRLLVGRYSVWLLGLLAIANGSLVLARLAKGWATTKRRFRDADVADLQLILAVIVVLALSQYLLLALLSQVREDAATDFFINYTAAMVLAQGRNIYDVSSLREASQLAEAPSPFFDFSSLFVTYITPPFHVILLVPFVPLGYEKARIAYLLLNNILLFSSLAMVLRARSAASRSSVPQCLLALLLVFTFEPIYVSLKLGQVDFVILFLIATSFWAYKSGRDAIVGVCLALAAMIKLSPALLIVYFLWKREFSVFVSAVVTTVLVGMLSWAIVGHEAVLFFSTTLLPALLKGSAFFQNQSLNGLISRFFVDPRLYYSLEEFPSIRQARVLSGLASLALVGVGAFITRKRIDRNSLRFDLEFSLAMVTMLLVSSISWEHYFTWLLIPFLILLDPELKSRLTTPRYMPLIITALLAYLTIIIPSRFYGVSLHSSDASFPVKTALTLLLSLRVYGALLLYSIFAYLIPKSQSRGSDSSIR
jgi:hypothetical protein